MQLQTSPSRNPHLVSSPSFSNLEKLLCESEKLNVQPQTSSAGNPYLVSSSDCQFEVDHFLYRYLPLPPDTWLWLLILTILAS